MRSEASLSIRAIVDASPRFEQVTGVGVQPRTVRPGERVLVDFIAIDDLGISSAEIEYVVREETRSVPIPMTGGGSTRAEGRMLFDLPKAREGELLRYRLRVRDTRCVDDAKLGPQEALYPVDAWCELKFSPSAPPLDQQEIFGVRDSIRTLLTKQLEELKQVHGDTQTLRMDTAGRSPLPIDHGLRLTAIRDRVRQVKSALEDGAKGLAVTPELRSQAASIREAADGPLADVGEQFRKAATDNAADRAAALATALSRLQEAIERLADLVKQNDRLAQDRLDRRRWKRWPSIRGRSLIGPRAMPPARNCSSYKVNCWHG